MRVKRLRQGRARPHGGAAAGHEIEWQRVLDRRHRVAEDRGEAAGGQEVRERGVHGDDPRRREVLPPVRHVTDGELRAVRAATAARLPLLSGLRVRPAVVTTTCCRHKS